MTRLSLQAAVNRGARLLDREEPDWFRKVKLTELDLASRCTCVLGQLHGDYFAGRQALGFAWGEAKRHGFVIDDNTFGADWAAVYRELTGLWRDAIRERREQKS